MCPSPTDDRPSLAPAVDRSGLAQVTLRAALDPGFRRRLLDDPRAAVREALGIELPPRMRLAFVEKDPGVDLMVVLPDPVEDVGALSDEQLDAVLGGSLAFLHEAA